MKKHRTRFIFKATFLTIFAVFTVISVKYIAELNTKIQKRFDGQRWSLPAVIYARPLELYPGLSLAPEMLEQELDLAGYRKEKPVESAGSYYRDGNTFRLISREFAFPLGVEPSANITIRFYSNKIRIIEQSVTGEQVSFLRLDPARIGSIHPLINEDRMVLDSDNIPILLSKGLIAIEDRGFYEHYGVSVTSIIRALFVNIKAGYTVQGGSTLTQQLVKNLFLGSERTLRRKIQEALMALLLECNYSKKEILTTYINEVFLGQDGSRAVHGFGLASRFYFRRDLEDLSTAQTATLIGMVKGPSYYDPRKNADACRARRNVVLRLMRDDNIITEEEFRQAVDAPLTDVSPQKNSHNRFPAFLDLVRRQLASDYREEDLKHKGLRIFTSLDPQIQSQIEEKLFASVTRFEEQQNIGNLQGAVVVTSRETAEVLGIAGDIVPKRAGFNRALDTHRPVGSLVKPAIYLTALNRGYTLASPLYDREVVFEQDNTIWHPENYDKKEHGKVALYQALAESFNLATVRLGLELGLDDIITTMRQLGYPEAIQPYPSLLLGSLEMSPLQVTQIYQTIGSGGFYQPLRAITSVLDQDNNIVTRYGLNVEQRFSPEQVFLLNHCLERVMSEGTGRHLAHPPGVQFAGKTGTSNDMRDSWFAGYSDSHLAVVWLGRDDNSPILLTGSRGAGKVWDSLMMEITDTGRTYPEPGNITWVKINTESLAVASDFGHNGTLLPFVSGTAPDSGGVMLNIDLRSIKDATRKLLNSIRGIVK